MARIGVLVASLVVAVMTLPLAPAARGRRCSTTSTAQSVPHLTRTGGPTDNSVLDGNGHLSIQARKTSFGYGTLIARIKVPSGQGLWPAFWMVGADEDSNPWPGAGEIDIVEMVSDPTVQGANLSGDFHDYWITRSADSITIGVDDTNGERSRPTHFRWAPPGYSTSPSTDWVNWEPA